MPTVSRNLLMSETPRHPYPAYSVPAARAVTIWFTPRIELLGRFRDTSFPLKANARG